MPCDDITEVLRLEFDAGDRLSHYALNKRTCGRAVGEEELLQEWATGRAPQEILDADLDRFLAENPSSNEAEEFLRLKHFFALRSGCAVYVGKESGGAADPCAIASMSYGPEGTEFVVQLSIEALTGQIKSCGRCGSCGSRK